MLGDRFFFSDFEPMLKLALMIRHLPLSLREHYIFAISPADPDEPAVASALLSFATAYSQRCARGVAGARTWAASLHGVNSACRLHAVERCGALPRLRSPMQRWMLRDLQQRPCVIHEHAPSVLGSGLCRMCRGPCDAEAA
jgi:hypothetical protein